MSLTSLIYKCLMIDSESSIDSSTDEDAFTIKIPLRGKVGRISVDLEIEEAIEYFVEYSDGGELEEASLFDDSDLFGDYVTSLRSPPRRCSSCSEVSVYHRSTIEYETKFYTRKISNFYLCEECYRYVRQSIYEEFINEHSDKVLAHSL